MNEKITINDLIEELNKLPMEQKNMTINSIGIQNDNGTHFYTFEIGNISIEIPTKKSQ